MSKEAVVKLIEIAETNSGLSKQLNSSKNAQAVLEIASEYNCQFTEEELIEVMQEKQLSFASDEALSEEQLEAVVGGKGNSKSSKTSYDNTDASSKSKVYA